MKTHPHVLIFGLALLACEPSDSSTSSDSADPATGTGETGTGDSTSETGDMPTTTAPTTSSTTDASTGTGTDGETELPEQTDSDDTTSDEPMCGDGIVDEGEACDDGILADDGPCVDGCNNNICGDGYVYAGVEMCDSGQQNGMYGGSCSEGCTTDNIPHCGDDILQGDYETCEVGETNGDGVSCDPNHCQWGDSRFIFVSSLAFTGSLESGLVSDEITGVARADALCQVLAAGANLPGSYYAWLSDNNGAEGSDAAARIGGAQDGADVVYVMPDGGAVVADGWENLVSEGPQEAIIRTESGDPLNTLPAYGWTNTAMNGNSLGENTCANWTSVNGFGSIGSTTTGMTWTNLTAVPCLSTDIHLYCIQGKKKEN